jgi:hypothetical protein
MYFSNRLYELQKKSSRDADATVLGHAKFGEMKACAERVASGAGKHPTPVRGKPGR